MLLNPTVYSCAPAVLGAVRAALPHAIRCLDTQVATYHASRQVVADNGPITALIHPLERHGHPAVLVEAQNNQNLELLRYSAHFPEPLWGHLAGLLHGRPFPTAVDMSCAAVGSTSSELSKRGFRVAQACPPAAAVDIGHTASAAAAAAAASHHHHHHPTMPHHLAVAADMDAAAACPVPSHSGGRLPGGVSDVVALLPGPRCLHAPELLAEARRLLAPRGYLAVAWNDRDLSSPFVAELEALLERLNPTYTRSSRQHGPTAPLLAGLSDGGALRLVGHLAFPHALRCGAPGVLADLLGGGEVARPHLAASSSHRKAFHQDVAALVRRHFGDAERPFELPLVSRLYVLAHAHSAAAHTSAHHTSTTSSSSSLGATDRAAFHSAVTSSSSSVVPGCSEDDEESGAMAPHVRTRRHGCCSRDGCGLRHLYA